MLRIIQERGMIMMLIIRGINLFMLTGGVVVNLDVNCQHTASEHLLCNEFVALI